MFDALAMLAANNPNSTWVRCCTYQNPGRSSIVVPVVRIAMSPCNRSIGRFNVDKSEVPCSTGCWSSGPAGIGTPPQGEGRNGWTQDPSYNFSDNDLFPRMLQVSPLIRRHHACSTNRSFPSER